MAVILKSRQEIGYLREAGRVVAETFEVLRPHVVPGTSTAELDKIAEDYILSRGAKPIIRDTEHARPGPGNQQCRRFRQPSAPLSTRLSVTVSPVPRRSCARVISSG